MPFNESLTARVRQSLDSRRVSYTEKKMFGGICFLVDDTAVDLDKDLDYWLNLCLAYNPKTKSSKKKA